MISGSYSMPENANKIQRVELCRSIIALHCPLGDDNGLTPRSPRFDSLMQITGIRERDIDYGDGHTDGFTDRVFCPASLKFAIYIFEPSGFAFYVGFAPNESDVLE